VDAARVMQHTSQCARAMVAAFRAKVFYSQRFGALPRGIVPTRWQRKRRDSFSDEVFHSARISVKVRF